MSKLSQLKSAASLKELALILGLPPKALAYTLYKITPAQKYTSFTIPKKSGGVRNISAPIPRLKTLQTYLADLLVECRAEVESRYPRRKLISHAFRAEGSIMTNAVEHRARRYVLNTDLEGFFPSFNFGRVRGYFIRNRHFLLQPAVATVLAQIACYKNELPQGSPCSPIISDLITQSFDMRMIKLMKHYKCTYSRYADDLTISTNRKLFPQPLAYQLEEGNSAWIAGPSLLNAVARAGFSLNHKKTRMQYRGSRQVVTGLTVNRTVNIRADYYRAARSMSHFLFETGYFFRANNSGAAYGPPPAGTIAQLEGIINHIYHVKSREDVRKKTLPAFREYHGIELLYRRLLVFKSFVNIEKPLIMAEGKTDNVYLRAAIKRLPKYAGVLTVGGATSECALKFLEHNNIVRTMLGVGGGSANFQAFIPQYKEAVSEFGHAPFRHPVIILIDNDDGASKIFGVLRQLRMVIDYATVAPFYLIARNLYLVKTPELGATHKSQIENLFDPATLAIKHGSKTFNMKNDTDTATEYGKAVFADQVIAPNSSKISFTGFEPLLDRIVAVIADHASRLAAGVV